MPPMLHLREVHGVAGKGPCFVAEHVLDDAQLFVEVQESGQDSLVDILRVCRCQAA